MQDVSNKFQSLKNNLSKIQIDVLPEIRKSVLQLQLPDGLVNDITVSSLPNNSFHYYVDCGKENFNPSKIE